MNSDPHDFLSSFRAPPDPEFAHRLYKELVKQAEEGVPYMRYAPHLTQSHPGFFRKSLHYSITFAGISLSVVISILLFSTGLLRIQRVNPTSAATLAIYIAPNVSTSPAPLSPTPTASSPQNVDGVWSVAFSPDNKQILTGSKDGQARLWDTQSATLLRTINVRSGYTLDASFSPNGKYMFFASSDNSLTGEGGLIQMFDRQTNTEIRSFSGSNPAFSQDGKLLLINRANNPAELWNLEMGQLIRTFDHPYSGGVFSPDNSMVLTGNFPVGEAQLWGVEDEKLIYTFPRIYPGDSNSNDTGLVAGLAFSPDGKLCAISNGNNNVLVWDLEKLTVVAAIPNLEGPILFTPKGDQIVIADRQGTVQLWNIADATLVRNFSTVTDSRGNINKIVISSDGKYLLAGFYDESAHLWNLDTGIELHVYDSHHLIQKQDLF